MKKFNTLLIIGKIPPPTGGVTIHVKRIIDKLEKENFNYHFEYLELKNILNLIKYFFLNKNVHLHTSNAYIQFILSFLSVIFNKFLIITLHSEFKQHKSKVKNKLENIALRLAAIPVVLNLKSYDLIKSLNNNTILDTAYIKPKIQIELPINIINIINKKKQTFNKIFCTNAYNMVFDINKKDLYGIHDLIHLFEGSKYFLFICDPSGSYNDYYKEFSFKNIYFITFSIDFISLLIKTDGFIRNTTTDGDSISIHEALFNNVNVFCTNVVDRPLNTILYNNAKKELLDLLDQSHNLLLNKSDVKENKIFTIYNNLNK